MRKAKKMKDIIERLTKRSTSRISDAGYHLRIENEPYMPLVIEGLGNRRISVAHYFTQNGDAIQDPDIVFWVGGDGEWYPIEIQDTFGYRQVVDFSGGVDPVRFNVRRQRELAIFANKWADNIRRQGFGK